MQFIPSNAVLESADVFSNIKTGSQNGKKFMSAMNDALQAVQDGDNHSVSSALKESGAPLVESPYVKHNSDGITYTLSEVCFTKNELKELRQQLVKEGAPETSLRQFDILASQPDGATLAQVMACLTSKKENISLSEDDEHAITAMLGQIDPTGQLATDVLNFMRNGNSMAAFEMMEDALAKMDLSTGLDVDIKSMLALGRGLGLTDDSMRGILENFAGRDSILLNKSQFDALMKPAKNQLLEEAAAQQKLDAALDKTLKPIISKARDRMEKEKAAEALQDRRVEQSRVLIDKTVQENSRQMIDDTATGQNPKAANLSGKNENEHLTLQDLQAQLEAKDLKTESGKKSSGQEKSFGNSDPSRQNSSEVWQNLLNKVETRSAAQILQAPAFVNAMQGDMEAAQPAGINLPNLPAHVANQVQQGMLTAFRDGATRLDLQLHPAELGAISISLVARNGELTAQIRSEKSETADMVSRQLDAIRINLEQQGIKVDKIEVQLQNSQDQMRDNFLDLGQHNARQEENARRQEMVRLRNLASLRKITENSSEMALAHDMHIREQQARYAGSALSVIA